jgi:hypothetical protein
LEYNDIGVASCGGIIDECEFTANGFGAQECGGEVSRNRFIKNREIGLYNVSGTICSNIISGNKTGTAGCTGVLIQNTISGNEAGVWDCSGPVYNNTIVGNKTYGIQRNYYYGQTIKNNIIAWNGIGLSKPNENFYNCFWKNNQGNFKDGAIAGPGDFAGDPRFTMSGHWDPNSTISDTSDDFWVEGEYHLKSQAGRWEPGTRQWVYDDVSSPCIDRGDPADAVGDEPMPNGGRINIGAYGGTAEASKSGGEYCSEAIVGDLNNDCQVNFKDFAEMAAHWMECNLEPVTKCGK